MASNKDMPFKVAMSSFYCYLIWAAPCKNVSLGLFGQRWPRSACAFVQSDQGLRCPLTEHWTIQTVSMGSKYPDETLHIWDESESVHCAHARRHNVAWRGPYEIQSTLVISKSKGL